MKAAIKIPNPDNITVQEGKKWNLQGTIINT